MKKIILVIILLLIFFTTNIFAISEIEAKKYIGEYVTVVIESGVSPVAIQGKIIDVVNTKNGKQLILKTNYSDDRGLSPLMMVYLKNIASITFKGRVQIKQGG